MLKKILAIVAMLFWTAIAMAAVDVNQATEAELDSVKGIGPGTSKLIVTERKKGDFKDWDDFITRVKGVGEKRAEHLSDAGLTVGGKAYKHAVAAKKDDKAMAKADEKKAEAKKDAKDAKADAKADMKEAKAEARKDKKDAKAEAKKDAASAKK